MDLCKKLECLSLESFSSLVTRLEKLVRDKHSSLLRKSVNYGLKKLMMQAPGGSMGIFSNFCLMKNHKIANNRTLTEAREKKGRF